MGSFRLGNVRKVYSQIINTGTSKSVNGLANHSYTAPQQTPLSGCMPAPVPDLVCPNAVPLFLFYWGIWTLTRKYNSDLSVRQGLFLLREPRQIHTLTLPWTAEQLPVLPYTFCTDPKTPGERFCSFVFTSLTFVLTTPKPPELPIHAVMAGKRLTDIFITKDHHVWVAACFPISIWTEECVSNWDVWQKGGQWE